MSALDTHDWAADPLFDDAIVRHGFAPCMRNYNIVVDVAAAKVDGRDIDGRYRYRITH